MRIKRTNKAEFFGMRAALLLIVCLSSLFLIQPALCASSAKVESKPAKKTQSSEPSLSKAALEAEKELLAAKLLELDKAAVLQQKERDALEADKARLAASQRRLDSYISLFDTHFSILNGMYIFFCVLAIIAVGLCAYLYRNANKAIKSAVDDIVSTGRRIEDVSHLSKDATEESVNLSHNSSEADALLEKLKKFDDEIHRHSEDFRDMSAKTQPSSDEKKRLTEYTKKLDVVETFSARRLTAREHVNRGIELFFAYKYLDALSSFDKAIEVKPDHAKAWLNKSITLFRLGRHDEALRACDKVIVLYSNDADPWYNKACILALMSRKEEAFLHLKKAFDRDKKYRAAAKKDEDFKQYWGDHEFIDMVG
ncbi:MAG: hypothetical protein A3J24_10570 [Deltaproteobacteria bacterium RIFCSPLOWO2_02_FULL_53_8]|nr:MAG: hypothetical protein A3J24_10570 [Deltaproteobacteria bacterium RIFCSPLOWO2_02_FULL_53_8]